MNILVIIPARGGSKGIPRKNLRPLGGKPLISYSIKNALQSKYKPDVFVSTDDQEIAYYAEKLGAEVHKRDPLLAEDATTLDPVIFNAYDEVRKSKNKDYDLIVTLQPTSPLLSVYSLDEAIQYMIKHSDVDTMLSAVNDTHLTWREENGANYPNYEKRVNRQYLPAVYKETGGFLITRNSIISSNGRIGPRVRLQVVSEKEAIDIDNFEDWQLCEYHLSKKNILFRVTGNQEIGLGHVYNCLILAGEILNHRVYFLTDNTSELAFQKIKASNYEVHMQSHKNIVDDIEKLQPDILINDCLDTDLIYMNQLKSKSYKILNIEDLGEGAKLAHIVINAIYPEKESYANHYFGPEYFCARDEFSLVEPLKVRNTISRVLLTFGGVDPNNLTYKVLDAIYESCLKVNIQMDVVLGMGYKDLSSIEKFEKANIVRDAKNISEYMKDADIAFTSAGRTTYELALLGIPSIILAQNEREMTHFFADENNGFKNLGLGINVDKKDILITFAELMENYNERLFMNKLMLKNNIKQGKNKVISLINRLIEN